MSTSERLLELIRTDPEVDLLLRAGFGFDIHRTYYGEGMGLASGEEVEVIAGEGAGGAYFLGAERDGRRPVVYASSEGEGGLLAEDLGEALEIMIGLEWQDCLRFSGGGDLTVMQASAQRLVEYRHKHDPDVDAKAAQVAEALSLRVRPVPELVARLHAAASRTDPEFRVVDENGELFDPLFDEWTEPRGRG